MHVYLLYQSNVVVSLSPLLFLTVIVSSNNPYKAFWAYGWTRSHLWGIEGKIHNLLSLSFGTDKNGDLIGVEIITLISLQPPHNFYDLRQFKLEYFL